jgi:hypothetical protein
MPVNPRPSSTPSRQSFLAALTLLAAATLPAAGEELELVPGTAVRFATHDEAAAVLGAADDHVQAMSPYDRTARLGRSGEVTTGEILAFAREQALSWEAGEVARCRTPATSLRRPLPPPWAPALRRPPAVAARRRRGARAW